ncbi:ROK family transcriptional regulator [Tessaracoccus antarcticus]|uniref:ROK family transcriptional regulator n=1 Tax=Tessaracoccus antarcticus TaxID=2479848 RepID=A0A3M0G1X1_9ACTN|nr:ROK family transcriptional regulator [Tessaracoccus antarcticus]RMB58971.1 ROK family transcriptional regulator [Tessaracoccus antarcticus]
MSTAVGPRVSHLSTQAALLDVIRGAGRISRVDLARRTGLTGATVSIVVRKLIDEGMVVEAGRAESTGGKPAVLLELDPDARFAIGVHLEQSGITYVLSNLGGAVVGRWRHTGAETGDPSRVVERISLDLTALIESVGVEPDLIVGLGVVSPGPLTGSVGMALTRPTMNAWTDFPLAEALQRATGLPVMLENDATAAAVGEYWAGTRGSSTCFAALYMGVGLGSGLMVRGDLYRGASSNTGEVGHICVELDGPQCWCGGRGCVEALAGPEVVVAQARAAGVDLPGTGHDKDFAALTRLALADDDRAKEILHRSARYVALAAQALANLMDLDRIVLTGPAFAQAGSLYVPAIRDQLDRSFFARTTHPIEVDISLHAAEAAAIGGAALVLQSELAPRASSTRALRSPTSSRVLRLPAHAIH